MSTVCTLASNSVLVDVPVPVQEQVPNRTNIPTGRTDELMNCGILGTY